MTLIRASTKGSSETGDTNGGKARRGKGRCTDVEAEAREVTWVARGKQIKKREERKEK
jgi:hypothetical protein